MSRKAWVLGTGLLLLSAQVHAEMLSGTVVRKRIPENLVIIAAGPDNELHQVQYSHTTDFTNIETIDQIERGEEIQVEAVYDDLNGVWKATTMRIGKVEPPPAPVAVKAVPEPILTPAQPAAPVPAVQPVPYESYSDEEFVFEETEKPAASESRVVEPARPVVEERRNIFGNLSGGVNSVGAGVSTVAGGATRSIHGAGRTFGNMMRSINPWTRKDPYSYDFD